MAQFYNLLLFLSLCVALPPVSPLFSLFYLSSHPGSFPLSLATLSSTSPVLPLLNSRLLPRFWFHYIGRFCFHSLCSSDMRSNSRSMHLGSLWKASSSFIEAFIWFLILSVMPVPNAHLFHFSIHFSVRICSK